MMKLTEINCWVWYQILKVIIYNNNDRERAIGPREHSLFLVLFLHFINVNTTLNLFLVEVIEQPPNQYISLAVGLMVFLGGYFLYYRSGEINLAIEKKRRPLTATLFVVISCVYALMTVAFMWYSGEYVREVLAA